MFIRVKYYRGEDDCYFQSRQYWLAESYRKRLRYHFRDVVDLGCYPISCSVEDYDRNIKNAMALFPEHRDVFYTCPITKRLQFDPGRISMDIGAWVKLANVFKESEEAREGLRRWEDRIVDVFKNRDEYHRALQEAWTDGRGGVYGVPRPWRNGADHLWMTHDLPDWMMFSQGPHKVLGVRVGASLADIKAAYRKKAVENHPDRGGDVGSMAKINAAYEQLARSRP